MRTWAIRIVVIAQLVWALGPLSAARVSAAGASFTVTVRSAFLRAEPSASAERTYSVFQGQSYAIAGRTADGSWVSLEIAAATAGTWLQASFGTIVGQLDSVPISGAAIQTSPQVVPQPSPATSQSPAGSAASTLLGIPGKTLQLTITAASLFALDAPDLHANRVASLFRGQQFRAVQRDPNAEWLQIELYGTQLVWVQAGAGQLDGNILDLPQPGDSVPPPPLEPTLGPGPSAPLPAWIPTISAHMRAVYGQSTQQGRDKRIFTVVGDCNSLSYYYLALVAKGIFDLQGQDYLRNTIEEFKSSFYRQSVAVSGGFNTASMLDPAWSDPHVCQSAESPFACELRVSRASIVFIALGTGDQFDWRNLDANYRRLIEFSLANGVLPVLVTKADALESEEGGAPLDYINTDIRALAQQYDVPLLDFSAATRDLRNHGLIDEPGKDFHLSGAGMGVHVMTTLQTLDALWRSQS
jgi:hypothetical protein